MDLEYKKLAIRRLIEESALPKPAPIPCVKHITVCGNNAIVAETVILQTGRSSYGRPRRSS